MPDGPPFLMPPHPGTALPIPPPDLPEERLDGHDCCDSCDGQGVQRIVNDLVERGFLEVKPNIDHKRAPLISISNAGTDTMGKVMQAQAVWVNQLADGLNESHIRKALQLLERVRTLCDETPVTTK